MFVRNSIRTLFFGSALAGSFAQNLPHPTQPAAASIHQVQLEEASSVPVPALAAESVTRPSFCDADGRIILRMAMPDTGIKDPVSVSKDGKTIIRFGAEKVNDIPQPLLASFFVLKSDLYILAHGSTPLGYEIKLRTPSGEIIRQPATKSSKYVAHFDHDGNYAGAVSLDLPFRPFNVGVFETGDFLISGIDRDGPRLAIVGSNGQLQRFIELKDDIHLEDAPDASAKNTDPNAFPRFATSQDHKESLFDLVSGTQITQDGPNLLLFRPLQGPVFSISASGEVQVHKLRNIENGYHLFTMKAAGGEWIVELMREIQTPAPATQFLTYAFDPKTGNPVRQYLFPDDLAWGLACTDGNEFTFVNSDPQAMSVKLVTLAPVAGS
jgi:hypothetical protein